jgi:hypothetical protein
MIPIKSLPKIEPDRNDGWNLVFWIGAAFDYTTPFRAALAEMVDVLGRQAPSSVRLPDHEDGEDFVEGSLRFGSTTVRVYYEYSLGYLSLTCASEDILREIASHLDSCLKVV